MEAKCLAPLPAPRQMQMKKKSVEISCIKTTSSTAVMELRDRNAPALILNGGIFKVDDVVRVLDSFGSRSDLEETVERSCSGRVPLLPGLVGRVLMKVRNPDVAVAFFDCVKRRPGFHHNTYSCNCLIEALVKARRHSQAYNKLKNELKLLCTPDDFSYAVLIRGYCIADDVEGALQIFEDMKQDNVIPSPLTFIHLIRQLFRKSLTDKGVDVFEDMIQLGCKPHSAAVYIICIDHLSAVGRFNQAYHYFGEMVRSGEFKGADNLTFIHNFFRASQWELGLRIFHKMINIGCHPHSSLYSAAIKFLCDAERFQEAKQIALSSSSSASSSSLCSLIIAALCKNGRWNEAYELVVRESNAGDVVVHTSFISSLCKNGSVEDAERFLQQMKMLKRFSPDSVTYNIIITSLCKQNKVKRAMEYMNEAIERRCMPALAVCSVMVDSLCKYGRMEDAENILANIPKPSVVMYSMMIDGLCKAHRVDDAMVWFKKMMMMVDDVDDDDDDGHVDVDVVAYSSMMHGLCREGRVEEAEMLFKEMRCIPDAVICNIMMKGLCDVKRADDALKFMVEMIKKGVEPNGITRNIISNIIFDGLCSEGRVDEAQKLFESM